MKLVRFVGIGASLCLCFLLVYGSVSAQQGASSASLSRTREQAQQQQQQTPNSAQRPTRKAAAVSRARGGAIQNYGNLTYNNSRRDETTADLTLPDVAVEEFVNYHKHRLPLPKAGQSVAMDVRWGNDKISARQPEAVLQIGFTTPEVNDRSDLPPVNLSLVIDKSGSMQDADKMSRVKAALHTMIEQLRDDDVISITVFDTDARVLLPARFVGDGREIHQAIDRIYPGGSTNLNAGLQLGYQEALKNFDKTATNRVLLLTDGIANVGVVAPEQIADNSIYYNRRGVDLSTIGVGADLDNDLLRTLAKSGRGLYHFVAESEDIEKVFVSEVQSLLSPVARDVRLTVDYPNAKFDLEQIYGYEPSRAANRVEIPLENMNNGLTAVVLMRFRAHDLDFLRAGLVVRLSYYDIRQKRRIERSETITLDTTQRRAGEMLSDSEVKKNYTIALLAQSLADMTAAARRGEFALAQRFVNSGVDAARANFPHLEDKDVRYVFDIAEDYQTKLRRFSREE